MIKYVVYSMRLLHIYVPSISKLYVSRNPSIISIYGLLRSLIDPVTRFVVENPRMEWANNIEKEDREYLNGQNKISKSFDYTECNCR